MILILAIATSMGLRAQNEAVKATDRWARVYLTFTDFEGAPLADELLVFTGDTTGYVDSCITDLNGHAIFLIPEGDQYWIRIEGVRAEERFHTLLVPAMPGPQAVELRLQYAPPPSITLNNVYFDTDRATLRPESYTELKRLAVYLKRKQGIMAEIQGHTDDVGDQGHNDTLSRNRALAVLRYLVQEGIDFRRLNAKGYGERKPVVPNDSPANRQKNRRVEVHFKQRY